MDDHRSKSLGFKVTGVQLHYFCDASERDSKLPTTDRQKWTPQIDFLVGKAGVVSLKVMTIPRLELTVRPLLHMV